MQHPQMIHDEGALQIDFSSEAMAVRGALQQARSAWHDWGVVPDDCATAEQVLAEVLNNVVEHAHNEDPNGKVRLSCAAEGSDLVIEVRDNGRPMPDLKLPEGNLAEVSGALEDLPEGGFGWFLIHMLTQDLSYRRDDGWNHLQFRIPGTA